MKILRDKVVAKCEETLKTNFNFPNKEAYTKFNSFVTNAFTGDLAQIPWRQFYRRNEDILSQNGQRRREFDKKEREWQSLVDSAIQTLETIDNE